MQVILKVLSALAATMTIIDAKDLQFRPLIGWNAWRLLRWLDDVQDDRDSILVGLAHDTDVRIGCKCLHRSECFRTDFTCLEEWQCALWLIFLQELRHSSFDALRGHLSLSAEFLPCSFGLLW